MSKAKLIFTQQVSANIQHLHHRVRTKGTEGTKVQVSSSFGTWEVSARKKVLKTKFS